MANPTPSFGFRWHGVMGDQYTPSSGLITLKAAYDTSGTFGEGDPLMFLGTGYVSPFTITTAVSQLAGIFKECSYYSTALGRRVWSNYYPGSGNVTGDVSIAVHACHGSSPQRFLVAAGSTAVTFGDLWGNTDIASGTGSGGTVTGGFYRSRCTLNSGTITNTATLPWRIVDLYSNIAAPGAAGTDNTSANNLVLVEANVQGATGI